MTRFILFLGLLAIPTLGAPPVLAQDAVSRAPDAAEAVSAFDRVLDHYEAVRQSLIHDHTEKVGEHGREIVDILGELDGEWSVEHAGVEPDKLDEARELLPALQAAAGDLAAARDLDAARDAFYALSKPLVRWRMIAASGESPVVAYCPMARRSWLQPAGEISNPYHGQSMLRCGEVVDG